jgi:tetratricopeptide (TPR) repeat protein
MKEYDEAKDFFEKALNVIPDHPDFLIGYGDVFYARGEFNEAFHYYISALNEEPDNYRAWQKAGIALLKLERYAEAREIFQTLLELYPHNGEIWYAHGLAWLGLGKEKEAKESFIQARRYKPNQPALWYTLSLLETSDEEAIQLLQRGHRIDPTNLDILLEIIRRLLSMKRTEDAVLYCEKVREISPENPRFKKLILTYMDSIP